jgi:predicted O-methyltransferase YrrM
MEQIAPSHVLEFGSGASTVWIASLMRDLHGERGGIRVFSIEQDEGTASAVTRDLDREGLRDMVRLVTAPVAPRAVWGRTVDTYQISDEEMGDLLDSARPDLVMIDGPAGRPGARFGTLPSVVDHVMPGALFYLDDALRRGELEVGAAWARSERIKVSGVHLVGRGLLAGRVEPGA